MRKIAKSFDERFDKTGVFYCCYKLWLVYAKVSVYLLSLKEWRKICLNYNLKNVSLGLITGYKNLYKILLKRV
jgi:hypothetical protein